MELKKSYKGFILWMAGFLAATFGIALFPIEDADMAVRIVMNVTVISIAILAFIIYKTEAVYWYTGVSYETAAKVGSERRKVYAWQHFQRFGRFAIAYFVFSVAAHSCGWSMWWDILVSMVGLVAVAVGTIGIKL